MALTNLTRISLAWFLIASSGMRLFNCTKFTMTNNCNETIWPGVFPNNFSAGGFALKPSQSAVFTAPPAWTGRIWARTGCNFDRNGTGTCQTGACGSSLQCEGPGRPPASIAEFTLGGTDFYDVSLVDGFNLPIVVQPFGGSGNCSRAGCDADLRQSCPPELALKVDGRTVACQSACSVFDKDEYCCRGEFAAPTACSPTEYSRMFKNACPAASSFAYDNRTSIITCSAAATDYMVAFCSSRNETRSQCTYHDNRLICSGAADGMLKVILIWKNQIWITVALAICVLL